MVHIPYLQPFADVNKRVSRIAANIPLNRSEPFYRYHSLMFPAIFIHKVSWGVYELNQVDLLKDIFLWAYERSAPGYAAVRDIIGEPDRFKMKYREEIRQLIYERVSGGSSRQKASAMISEVAKKVLEEDRNKFIESCGYRDPFLT